MKRFIAALGSTPLSTSRSSESERSRDACPTFSLSEFYSEPAAYLPRLQKTGSGIHLRHFYHPSVVECQSVFDPQGRTPRNKGHYHCLLRNVYDFYAMSGGEEAARVGMDKLGLVLALVNPPEGSDLGALRARLEAKYVSCPPFREHIDAVFSLADFSADGKISLPEFSFFVSLLRTPPSTCRLAFHLLDKDGSGFVDENELSVLIRSLADSEESGWPEVLSPSSTLYKSLFLNPVKRENDWWSTGFWLARPSPSSGSVNYERFVEELAEVQKGLVSLIFLFLSMTEEPEDAGKESTDMPQLSSKALGRYLLRKSSLSSSKIKSLEKSLPEGPPISLSEEHEFLQFLSLAPLTLSLDSVCLALEMKEEARKESKEPIETAAKRLLNAAHSAGVSISHPLCQTICESFSLCPSASTSELVSALLSLKKLFRPRFEVWRFKGDTERALLLERLRRCVDLHT